MKYSKKEKQRIITLYGGGKEVPEICEITGYEEHMVRRFLKANGIDIWIRKDQKRLQEIEIEIEERKRKRLERDVPSGKNKGICELYKTGEYTQEQLGYIYNISKQAIHIILKRYNISKH